MHVLGFARSDNQIRPNIRNRVFIESGRALVLVALMGLFAAEPARAAGADEAALETGERLFSACRTCHTTNEGGTNKVGPNLYGVFGSKAGSKPSFNYSDVLKNSGIVWSKQTLNEWLTKPNEFLKGTKMAFAGIKNESDRDALIAYLQQETSAQ